MAIESISCDMRIIVSRVSTRLNCWDVLAYVFCFSTLTV